MHQAGEDPGGGKDLHATGEDPKLRERHKNCPVDAAIAGAPSSEQAGVVPARRNQSDECQQLEQE